MVTFLVFTVVTHFNIGPYYAKEYFWLATVKAKKKVKGIESTIGCGAEDILSRWLLQVFVVDVSHRRGSTFIDNSLVSTEEKIPDKNCK